MAKYFDYCPQCRLKGLYTPIHPAPEGFKRSVCRYCDYDQTINLNSDSHSLHCCKVHGCKYSKDTECTVMLGTKAQEKQCEYCERDKQEKVMEDPTPEEPVNKNITLDDVRDYIKKNLSIDIRGYQDYYSNGIEVSLRLDGEEISSSTHSFGSKGW